MFVFAIETCGRTVAFTKEVDRIMLDGVLNGQREEGQQLRDGLLALRHKIGAQVWDGVSPFTARLATDSEDLDYHGACASFGLNDDESTLMFLISNEEDEDILVIPPDAKYNRALKNAEDALRCLAEQGLVVDSGRKGRSKRTGLYQTVWVAAERKSIAA